MPSARTSPSAAVLSLSLREWPRPVGIFGRYVGGKFLHKVSSLAAVSFSVFDTDVGDVLIAREGGLP